MDIEAVERALTRRTKALLPVHLYGHPADMDPLLEIARNRKAMTDIGSMQRGLQVGPIV